MRANESTPFWPKGITAPAGAPNVMVILIDDAGFGATSAFGGPIPTPTFEKLAARGLRYTAFHTTALCSPTRAALLTGRNHHSVHTGTITEMASGAYACTLVVAMRRDWNKQHMGIHFIFDPFLAPRIHPGFPGYDTLMQKDTASVGEILKQRGWNTLWSGACYVGWSGGMEGPSYQIITSTTQNETGKNHNVPDWQSSQTGPFDLWPNNLVRGACSCSALRSPVFLYAHTSCSFPFLPGLRGLLRIHRRRHQPGAWAL